MKRLFKFIGLLLVLLAIVFAFGPRPDADQTLAFDPSGLPEDLEAYLASTEADISDLRDNAAKEIDWQLPFSKQQTEIAVVYVHGFSASKVETAPVSQNVASALNANLFLTRLTGHGRSGDAMAEASLSDWLNDTAEAITIGKRLGKKVVLVSASTGGSLSVLAMTKPELAEMVDALVLISPNFAIQGAPTWLMNMPWAETLLPALLGAERSFEPSSEAHANGWTHKYPTSAIFPMGALLKTLDGVDYGKINKPALFIYSTKDTVVVPEKTEQIIDAWGGETRALVIDDSEDADNHVIAGDIKSPNTTDRVSSAIIEWVRSL